MCRLLMIVLMMTALCPCAAQDEATSSTVAPTAPPTSSTCSPGVCRTGKWISYSSTSSYEECEAACENGRHLEPVPDGVKEEVYTFRQNGRFHSLSGKSPRKTNTVTTINYRRTGGYFPGFPVRDQFYARWSGYIEVTTGGGYEFATKSDDGSRLYVNDKKVVDNGGWHGMRWRSGKLDLSNGKHPFWAEMFEGGGGAGMELYYKGADTSKNWVIVPASVLSGSLSGSGEFELFQPWKKEGACAGFSHSGTECILYTTCAEVSTTGKDGEDLVCQDPTFDYTGPLANFTTCSFPPLDVAAASSTTATSMLSLSGQQS